MIEILGPREEVALLDVLDDYRAALEGLPAAARLADRNPFPELCRVGWNCSLASKYSPLRPGSKTWTLPISERMIFIAAAMISR